MGDDSSCHSSLEPPASSAQSGARRGAAGRPLEVLITFPLLTPIPFFSDTSVLGSVLIGTWVCVSVPHRLCDEPQATSAPCTWHSQTANPGLASLSSESCLPLLLQDLSMWPSLHSQRPPALSVSSSPLSLSLQVSITLSASPSKSPPVATSFCLPGRVNKNPQEQQWFELIVS